MEDGCDHAFARFVALDFGPSVVAAFLDTVEFVKTREHAAATVLCRPQIPVIIPCKALGVSMAVGIHRIAERIIIGNGSIVMHAKDFSRERRRVLRILFLLRVAGGDVEKTVWPECECAAVMEETPGDLIKNHNACCQFIILIRISLDAVMNRSTIIASEIQIQPPILFELRMESNPEQSTFTDVVNAVDRVLPLIRADSFQRTRAFGDEQIAIGEKGDGPGDGEGGGDDGGGRWWGFNG